MSSNYSLATFVEVSQETGCYNLKNRRGAALKNVPNIAARGGQPPEPGERVLVGYYNNDKNDIFCVYPSIATHIGGEEALFAPWLRRATRTVGRYLPDVPEETTLLLGAVTPSESRDPGRILRAFPSSEGVDRVWSQAWSVVINGAAQEEGEPGSDVVALWASGGVRLVMIEGAVEAEETYGDGFTEGYEAGYSDPGEFISPYDAGGSAYHEGTGYDPFLNYSYPAPPTGHGEDYNSGWVDGHLALS